MAGKPTFGARKLTVFTFAWLFRRLTVFTLLTLFTFGAAEAQELTEDSGDASADRAGLITVCPTERSQAVTPETRPGGMILTHFNAVALWVYDADSGRRYPLSDTLPCARSCRLSPDARWLIYYNTNINGFNRMHLDGSARSFITDRASDVEWWTDETYLVWTTARGAYLFPPADDPTPLYVEQITTIQPGGLWGVRSTPDARGGFTASLVEVELLTAQTLRADRAVARASSRPTPQPSDEGVILGADTGYFNARAWSPSGDRLGFVALSPPTRALHAEIYTIAPGDDAAMPITDLAAAYGAARINGLAAGELAWSPDGRSIAFWAGAMTNDNPADAEAMRLHIVDTQTRQTRVYCAFETITHTPNPPRLAWSPDGDHIAFAGDLEDNDGGVLLLALDVETGGLLILSDGVAPALGTPDVIAWGLPPNE